MMLTVRTFTGGKLAGLASRFFFVPVKEERLL